MLIRTFILDIKQQDGVEGCISDSFNVVKIPKATKALLIIDVAKKKKVFIMKLITKLNAHPPSKLSLERLKRIHYKICLKGFFTQGIHEVEDMGLSNDVGIIMEKGKKLTWYLGHV
jgi:hypothetical protein